MAPYLPAVRSRRLAAAGLVTAVMLILTGCARLNMFIDLHENDRASMSLNLAFQDEALREMGQDPAEFWAGAQQELEAGLPSGARVQSYPEPGWSGFNVSILDTPISELDGFDDAGMGGVMVTRDGDYYIFRSASGLADELEGVADQMPAGVEALDLTLQLSCPGAIAESNGTIMGNMVRWDLTQFTSAQELTARCSAIADPTWQASPVRDAGWFGRWWPVILGGLLTLGLLAGLGYFLRRRSHDERDTEPSNFGDTANWMTPDVVLAPEPHHRPYQAPRTELDQGFEEPVDGGELDWGESDLSDMDWSEGDHH